jgi:hypothetical protein
MRAALARAYLRAMGKPASPALLDVLSAQAALETGRGASMYNWNFGGIKGASPQGMTATYMTREVTASGDVHVRQGFRAYATIDDGASDYIHVMRGRFGHAMEIAERGDVDGFAHALKQSGYYTASEAEYASALRGILGKPAASAPQNAHAAIAGATSLPSFDALTSFGAFDAPRGSEAMAAMAGGASYATSGELSRVLDALSLSAAQIAAPSDEEP